MKRPMVLVEWIDSALYTGWKKRRNDYCPSSCQTIGFLLERGRKQVVVAMQLNDEEDVGEVMVIPRCNVLSITRLYPQVKQ